MSVRHKKTHRTVMVGEFKRFRQKSKDFARGTLRGSITLIIGSQNIQQLIDFLIRRVEHDFLSRAAKEGGALL